MIEFQRKVATYLFRDDNHVFFNFKRKMSVLNYIEIQ
jgi:hypothetical protein